MTEEEIRKIIQDELRDILKIDRYVFDKKIKILDARNIQVGRANGTSIGTETDQKIGFYGSAATQAALINDPSGGGTAGVDQPARDAVISILTALKNMGIIASS